MRSTETRWRDLQEVNTFVNHIVIPATDLEYYQQRRGLDAAGDATATARTTSS